MSEVDKPQIHRTPVEGHVEGQTPVTGHINSEEAERLRKQQEQQRQQGQQTPARTDNPERQRQSALTSAQVQSDIDAKKDSDAHTPQPKLQQPQNVPPGQGQSERQAVSHVSVEEAERTIAGRRTTDNVSGRAKQEPLMTDLMIDTLVAHMTRGDVLFSNLQRELQKQSDVIKNNEMTIEAQEKEIAELQHKLSVVKQAMSDSK